MADVILEIVNEKAESKLQLKYNRYYIGMQDGGRSRNIVSIEPHKAFSYLLLKPPGIEEWRRRLEEAGLNVGIQRSSGTLRISLKPAELISQRALLTALLHTTTTEYDSD